jgi:hypothetical protein
MTMTTYKNIYGRVINVNAKRREVDEVFEERDSQEIQNLLKFNYIEQLQSATAPQQTATQ